MAYRRHENVVTRKIAGETLLVPIRGNLADMQNLFVLEGTGEFIWNLLDGCARFDELADAITSEYDTDVATASGDLREFLDALVRRELIIETNSAP